ncbi:MAG: hypothetical protein JST85_20975 [Acidobacteria bacterium]|nr:hypothetical protein [Acidobacteriota bacterium]
MKRQLTTLLMAICVSLILTMFGTASLAQSSPPQAPVAPKYAVLEYMKIEPGKNADYRKMEQEVWMPIHRERVKAKLIRSWALWGVRYPGGTAREYDVVAVTLHDNFKDLENSYPLEVFAKAHPGKNAAELTAQTGLLRKMVRTEVVSLIDFALPGAEDPRSAASAAPAKYVRFDYKRIEPGKAGEYVANERKYYKPYWQEVVNQGAMRGWAVFGVRFPSGTDKEYSFVTVQLFDKFENLEGTPSWFAAWAKANPNAKFGEVSTQMGAISKTVRSEVLTLLDRVQ